MALSSTKLYGYQQWFRLVALVATYVWATYLAGFVVLAAVFAVAALFSPPPLPYVPDGPYFPSVPEDLEPSDFWSVLLSFPWWAVLMYVVIPVGAFIASVVSTVGLIVTTRLAVAKERREWLVAELTMEKKRLEIARLARKLPRRPTRRLDMGESVRAGDLDDAESTDAPEQ